MDHSVFTEISLIISIGAGVALIMHLLKQPLIIGHIITGVIVGPTALDIVHAEDTVEVFVNIGIVLLLFIIGLGLNPKIIKELGKVSTVAGLGQVLFTTTLGLAFAMAFSYTFKEAAFIGIGLAFSSTIIILKLISDKKEQTRLYGKIAIGILLVQDIIATFALLMLSASNNSGSFSILDFALLFVEGGLISALLFIIGTHFLPKFQNTIASSQEFLFLFALGWGFGAAALFNSIGFSIEVGALIAGIALAQLPYTQEMSARLRPLRDFFIVIFFISLGAELNLSELGASVIPAITLSLFVIICNPIVVMTLLGLLGYTKRTSFKTGITMAQISEFSLIFLILAQRQGHVSSEIINMMTLVAFITIGVSSYMIIYTDQLFEFFERNFKIFEQKKVQMNQQNTQEHDIILFGYLKGGSEFIKTFKTMKRPFVVVDYNPDVVDDLAAKEINYIYGDANDIELLDEIGIEKAKLVVSAITEHKTNMFLVTHTRSVNPDAVVVCHSDSKEEAKELYDHGATYVMMSHSIGSEKIGAFIKKNGLKKTEFKKFRDKHMAQL